MIYLEIQPAPTSLVRAALNLGSLEKLQLRGHGPQLRLHPQRPDLHLISEPPGGSILHHQLRRILPL